MIRSDPSGETHMIEELEYSVPTTPDDVLSGLSRLIVPIPWFSRAAVVADAESGFGSLAWYAWGGKFFVRIPMAALLSRVWADLIAVDKVYFSYRVSFAAKRVRHENDLFHRLNSLPQGTIIVEAVDVYFW